MLIAKAAICLAILGSDAAVNAQRFSVTDSIQMVRFNGSVGGNLDGDAIFSPEGTYAAVVTSRGLLSSNQIESTIWMFEARTLRQFVNTQDDGHARSLVHS